MINRVILVGRLTRDPELRKTGTGVSVASFTVAVDNRGKTPDGKKTASFINCKCWRECADNTAKYCRKGSLVGVDGRLNQNSYTKADGTKASIIEIIADSVQFLEPKGESMRTNEEAPGFVSDEQPTEDSKNLDTIDVADEDLPF